MLIIPDDSVIRLDLAPSCAGVCIDTDHLRFERADEIPNFAVGLWRAQNGRLRKVEPALLSDRLQEVHGLPRSVFPIAWDGDPPVRDSVLKNDFLGYYWHRGGLSGYVKAFWVQLQRDCGSDGEVSWSLNYRGRYTLPHYDPSANLLDELGVGEVLGG